MSDIFAIAAAGEIEKLRAALAAADPMKLHNEAGESLYRFALFHGHPAAAEAVKAHGGLGPHDAALTNDTARLRALLADSHWALDLLSPDGWTALHLAAFVGADDAVDALIKMGASARIFGRAFEQNLPIHAAAAGRRIGRRAFESLVAATGDPDVRQKQGYTALMIAASNGFDLACEVLLAAGADRGIALPDGKTAASIARERGHAGLAEKLG